MRKFLKKFGICILLASACTPQQEVKTPTEQLPSPEFKTKPQIYMVFNESLIPFSSPSGDDLSGKLNYNVTVASVKKTAELQAKVREYNARPSDILFVGPSLLSSEILLKSLAHTTRKASFILDWGERAQEFPSRKTVLLNMAQVERNAEQLCELIKKDLAQKCQSVVKVGAPDANESSVSIAWAGSRNAPVAQNALFVLSVNWQSWLQQVMLKLSKGEIPTGSLMELSFANGNIAIELNPSFDRSKFAGVDLEKAKSLLFDFKMKALQQ